ncbi:hypothetical protein ACFSNO_13290 [Streptomyces cirratus]|uniref:hypothetical protein n=1 Tax=Streptomyces cirratus TaxID=68187 RepID=UPI0027E3C74C|nr:hypothetical protein [Streptomyces cirratus]
MRDIASGAEGELMAVINENVSDSVAHAHWVELAYIRGVSGREFTTAVGNIEAVIQPVRCSSGQVRENQDGP